MAQTRAGLVSARPRTATVEAIDDVTAMVVTRAVLQESRDVDEQP